MKAFVKYFLLVLGSLIVLTPLVIALIVSLIDNASFTAKGIDFSLFTLQNYFLAFSQANLLTFMINSLVISVFLVAAQLLVSSLAAYAFVFIEFRSKAWWFSVFLATLMVPLSRFSSPTLPASSRSA
ncbi:hypothetical protein [Lactococcus termiticola]|uniref:Glycerol-3-phosphate ABC transporter permease protein n=1 Tax=Lactococcus termiticola TaxID=2169526 RepID=A0A2R5HHT3_9LACT|nr:hypothetical protein [Lactococcus termiticola]GBG97436.1 glycerol-3-phosphate ABC transporter permease protein [Lactococcus termiticola]